MNNATVIKALRDKAVKRANPAGKDYFCLSVAAAGKLASELALSVRQIELIALENLIIPERYERSIGTVGVKGQIRLLESTAGVIGAGGLGGFVLELLARMGVGRLVVVDGDTFSDSNLNRQLLATEENLGIPKVEAAVTRIASVNAAVAVEAHQCRGDGGNLPTIFAGCDIVLDCLDNLSSRFALEKVCAGLNLIMVHGAIAGFLGQVAVIRPDRPLLKAIYGQAVEAGLDRGVETEVGNPSATPAMVAAWQAGEAVKALAGLEGVLPANRLLIIDMQRAEAHSVELNA